MEKGNGLKKKNIVKYKKHLIRFGERHFIKFVKKSALCLKNGLFYAFYS